MIRFRDSIERKFWGDVFHAAETRKLLSHQTSEGYADDALIRMRVRQGTVEALGRNEESCAPIGYRVCAVCEGRTEHDHDCLNFALVLPFSYDLKVIE